MLTAQRELLFQPRAFYNFSDSLLTMSSVIKKREFSCKDRVIKVKRMFPNSLFPQVSQLSSMAVLYIKTGL